MAAGVIVVPSLFPARDRNNRLVAGALMEVRVDLTTTKAAIFSDSGLTTPLANPVPANGSGVFPLVWAEAGTAEDPVLYTISISGPGGISIANPSVFSGWQPSVDAETGQAALALAAAEQVAIDKAAIIDLAENGPQAPSIAGRAMINGQNVVAAEFRASLGLTSPIGAGLIGFMLEPEGAVRTIFDKLAERISLEDFYDEDDGPFWNAAARRAITAGQAAGSGIGAYVYGAPGKAYDFDADDTIIVPDGAPIVFALTHNRVWVHGDGRLFELRAWRSEINGADFQAATPATSGTEWVYLKGAFTKVIGCRFNGDWTAIRMEGVACRILDCQFDDGAAGGRRVWATGGDTSQIIRGCLFGAEALGGQPECAIFADNSAALTICDSSIISQGHCVFLAPGSGQGIYSLRLDNLFLDTAVSGVYARPSGTGAIVRTQIGLTWSSSHSGRGFDFETTSGGVIDGVTFTTPEVNLCAQDGIRFVGPNSKNLRVNGGSGAGNDGACFVIGLGATGIRISDFVGGPIDGISDPTTFGVFIDGTAEYEIRDCDFSGCGTPISGHTPGANKVISNVKGFTSRAKGVATILSGASSVAVSTGLSADLGGKQDIRIWLADSADAAGKTGVFVSAIAGAGATIAADPVGVTTADIDVCWEASIE